MWKPKSPAADPRHQLGQTGERAALDYLLAHSYRIVVTNYTAPIGNGPTGRPITGEIDLIAYDETARPFVLSFIEVKTRTGTQFAAPETAVDRNKQRHIIKAARIYRRVNRVQEEPFRYDVVTVVMAEESPRIELLKSYFSEETFARSHWARREY
jgi:putative endonuclease